MRRPWDRVDPARRVTEMARLEVGAHDERPALFVPEGQKTTVAQQFIAGIARIRRLSPRGTAEGLLTDETQGYIQPCLRHSPSRHSLSQQ
jgi:hypothetical protein